MNDTLEVEIEENNKIKINQYELTEVVEARVSELLKLAKNQILYLTNRKISYIIVTGGMTELMGFNYVVESVFDMTATVMNISTVGIRNNKFSSSIGIIKYFHDKMKLRQKDISLIDDATIEKIEESKQSMLDLTEDTFISKIFGYFADN